MILGINAKYVHTCLAAWVLCAGVKKYARTPHDVQVQETNINQRVGEIAEKVAARQPDVVGISSYIWNAGMLPEILRLLRERLPGAALVLGGPEASHNTQYWLSHADYVISGEGERSFPALLDALAQGAGVQSVPGLHFRENGKMRSTPEAAPTDEPIDPYDEVYFAAQGQRIAYIETSRGCPFDCAFCLSGGSRLRFFPIDAAKDQIRRLSGLRTGTIKFVDRTFNCNPDRAYELMEFVIGLEGDCRFHFEVAPDLFDARTLALLRTALPGRIQLEAGLQSFFPPALEASSRRTDTQAAQRNIRALLEGGNIHMHLDLIAGLPCETLPDFMDSFDRAYALSAHTLQLGFLKMLHGSRMRRDVKSILYSQSPPYEITGSPWMSADDLKTLKTAENALQHTHNKGRFLSSIGYVLEVSGLRPFEFYRSLGQAVQSHATPLEEYAAQVYRHLAKQSGVDQEELLERMICDWLGMVKGKNMPRFMRIEHPRKRDIAQEAKRILVREVARHEAAALPLGKGAFVDSQSRNPVTGLYRVYHLQAQTGG